MTIPHNDFSHIAQKYDRTVLKIIPNYEIILDVVTSCIPFSTHAAIRILDIGCGTGNASLNITQHYKKCKIHLLDSSAEMIAVAKQKIPIKYIEDDVTEDIITAKFAKKYDLIVSTFALHHLVKSKKKNLMRYLYGRINTGGLFIIADQYSSPKVLHDKYYLYWETFLKKSFSKSAINNKILRHHRERDHQIEICEEVKILHEAGFKYIDVPYKNYCNGVICSFK